MPRYCHGALTRCYIGVSDQGGNDMVIQCRQCENGETHYIRPDLARGDFTCPYCNEHARQESFDLFRGRDQDRMQLDATLRIWEFIVTRCGHCGGEALWRMDRQGDVLLSP